MSFFPLGAWRDKDNVCLLGCSWDEEEELAVTDAQNETGSLFF